MDKQWQENIFSTIEGFANIDRQNTSWRGLNNQDISSYIEDFNLLFFSFDFEDFIDTWKAEELDNTLLTELIEFKDVLICYDNNLPAEKQFEDIKILEDPKWLYVVDKAKKIVNIWRSYLRSNDNSNLQVLSKKENLKKGNKIDE